MTAFFWFSVGWVSMCALAIAIDWRPSNRSRYKRQAEPRSHVQFTDRPPTRVTRFYDQGDTLGGPPIGNASGGGGSRHSLPAAPSPDEAPL